MKNVNNLQRKIKKILTLISLVLMMLSMLSTVALASGTPPSGQAVTDFDNIIKFIAGWIGKLGLVVGFIGAVQLGFAFKNDDADGKTKGLRTLISGFIVFAITQTLSLFGIT